MSPLISVESDALEAMERAVAAGGHLGDEVAYALSLHRAGGCDLVEALTRCLNAAIVKAEDDDLSAKLEEAARDFEDAAWQARNAADRARGLRGAA